MKQQLDDKKKKAKKRIIIESLIVFAIIVSPFVFKMHSYVSTDPDASLNFFGISIGNNGFQSVNVYIWFLLGKIVPLYLLIIWFFTCKEWWYHIITIPILMYAFQIFEVIFSNDGYIDTENIMWLLPVCMVVIPFVYFIRIKLYDKHVHGIDLEAMDAELRVYKEKERLRNEGKDTGITHEATAAHTEESTVPTNKHKQDHFFVDFQDKISKWLDLKF